MPILHRIYCRPWEKWGTMAWQTNNLNRRTSSHESFAIQEKLFRPEGSSSKIQGNDQHVSSMQRFIWPFYSCTIAFWTNQKSKPPLSTHTLTNRFQEISFVQSKMYWYVLMCVRVNGSYVFFVHVCIRSFRLGILLKATWFTLYRLEPSFQVGMHAFFGIMEVGTVHTYALHTSCV